MSAASSSKNFSVNLTSEPSARLKNCPLVKPIFSKVHNESNPWCFAAYAENQEEAIQWFDWGWQNNVEVFSWPPLREEQITSNNKAFLRWQKVVCFSTDC